MEQLGKKKESSHLLGDLTDGVEEKIIEKVIIERTEGGRDAAVFLFFFN